MWDNKQMQIHNATKWALFDGHVASAADILYKKWAVIIFIWIKSADFFHGHFLFLLIIQLTLFNKDNPLSVNTTFRESSVVNIKNKQ